MSARPIASIFCSPPERPEPLLRRNSASTGKSSNTRSSVQCPSRRVTRRTICRFSSTVRSDEDAPVVRHVADAEPGDLERLAGR